MASNNRQSKFTRESITGSPSVKTFHPKVAKIFICENQSHENNSIGKLYLLTYLDNVFYSIYHMQILPQFHLFQPVFLSFSKSLLYNHVQKCLLIDTYIVLINLFQL